MSEVNEFSESAVLDLAGLPEPLVKSIKQIVQLFRQGTESQGHSGEPHQHSPLRGRFADLQLSFPTEILDEAQRETWAKFPRDFLEPGQS
jgi:hypothetical protein